MHTEDWGLIPYKEALARQLEKVESVVAGAEDTLIFCSHPPVVTLGRGSKPEDITSWQGETHEISRGGRATYHGPGQIVVYPIINLNIDRKKISTRDLHSYLRALEESIVLALKEFGLAAEVRSVKLSENEPSLTGVWVKDSFGIDKKIASIGIAVKKWVTYHGAALNLYTDAQAFSGIRPCGFTAETMTSIEYLLKEQGKAVPERSQVQRAIENFFSKTTACRL